MCVCVCVRGDRRAKPEGRHTGGEDPEWTLGPDTLPGLLPAPRPRPPANPTSPRRRPGGCPRHVRSCPPWRGGPASPAPTVTGGRCPRSRRAVPAAAAPRAGASGAGPGPAAATTGELEAAAAGGTQAGLRGLAQPALGPGPTHTQAAPFPTHTPGQPRLPVQCPSTSLAVPSPRAPRAPVLASSRTPTLIMEFSSGAVTCLALSMAPSTCCWCWWEGEREGSEGAPCCWGEQGTPPPTAKPRCRWNENPTLALHRTLLGSPKLPQSLERILIFRFCLGC